MEDHGDFNLDEFPVDFREFLVEDFLNSIPNLNPAFTYAPQPPTYDTYPPVPQPSRLQITPAFDTIERSSAPDSVPGWSPSPNETEASHSRNISSVNTPISMHATPDQRKRKFQRECSSGSDSGNELTHQKKCARRSPTEGQRQRTNQVRGDKACLPCQLEKRGCTPINPHDPESPCDRCYKRLSTLSRIVLCCRVNITDLEIFRYGPTQSLAQTLRYLITNATQTKSKPIKKLTDAPRRYAPTTIKVVNLSQGHGHGTLNLKIQNFDPKNTDRVNYTWKNGETIESYNCPPCALADLENVQISLENFLENNTESYVRTVLSGAEPITKTVFDAALAFFKESALVKLALRFWVASRFIEDPWHILGQETLGMVPDTRSGSPYFGRIPVTPMMDNQIDNIVIYHLLEPQWKKLRKIVRTKLLEHKKQDWFELQLTLFILLNHVELTMAHDVEFSNRHSLSTTFSNALLIEKVTHAAQTLLKYFHNPGINMYYPFHAPWRKVEADYGWADEQHVDSHESQKIQTQKEYVLTIRNMLAEQRKRQTVPSPGTELFWTAQLYGNDWAPIEVKAYS